MGRRKLEDKILDSISNCSVFSPSECQQLIESFRQKTLTSGEIFSTSSDAMKDSKIRSVSGTEVTDDLMKQFISGLFKEMNPLELEISGIQPIQIFRYQAGDHYDWHTDWSPNAGKNRKLSMTIQLSESSDYEGGGVEIFDGIEPRLVCRTIGYATVFPSWALHRVQPLISGTRWAMVAWAIGAPFN